MKKVLLTIWENDVAPRFDLASEVLVVVTDGRGGIMDRKTLVLPRAGAEQMCSLALSEGVDIVVCGGIQAEYHQYLGWKNVLVLDSVIGPYERALELLCRGELDSGALLFQPLK